MVSREWMDKDFYAVLGVASDASSSDIKSAYRKLARELHPDHNPDNPKAEDRFKEVSEAFAVLSDDAQRKEYDEMRSLMGAGAFRRGARMGNSGMGSGSPVDLDDLLSQARGGFGGSGAGGGLGDIFGSFFGNTRRRGPTKGRDVETRIDLDFTDAVNGITLPLKLRSPGVCDTCHGDGAKPGTSPQVCPTCHGAGVLSANQGSFSFAEPCRDCEGVGTIVVEKCPECQGSGGVTKTRTITIRVPEGVRDGQRIRLSGRGEPGERGGPTGDLYVTVNVRPHELFTRDGDNLRIRVPISLSEAGLGTTLRVPTLTDPVRLRIPAGTPSGRVLRVKDRGVATKKGHGDLLVTVDIDVPKELSAEAKEALAEYAKHAPPAPRQKLQVDSASAKES